VDPIESLALAVELALGGVDVFRPLLGSHRPRAEAQGPAARVDDREGDSLAEAVVDPSPASPLDEAGGAQLVDAKAGPLATGQHLVPGTWRVADPEFPQNLLAEPP